MTSPSGTKWPTTAGAEDFHVIRLAEVLLIKAEALARQNDLAGAVDTYNPIRVRAGPARTCSARTSPPRRRCWRRSTWSAGSSSRSRATAGPTWCAPASAVAVLGIPASQTLFPIPQAERDVAPGITQNPGY